MQPPPPSKYNLRSRSSPSEGSYRTRAARYLAAQCLVERLECHHIYDDNGKKLTMENLLRGPDGESKWIPALSNEWGRLAQGNDAGAEIVQIP